MAVAVQAPTQRKSNSWGSTTTKTCIQELSLSMIDIMSYQYPPPPHNGADLDVHMQHSSYMSSYPPPATSSMEGMNDADHGHLGLSGEKRRNKLGYHRTSVACGHCRRRKIRCIPQQADIHGRCMNCIRLKKECSFFPVEQQPPPVTVQKPGAVRSSVGPKIASASSSPAISTGHPSEILSHQSYPQLATMPSLPNMGPPSIKPPGSEGYGADPKMPSSASSSRSFEYGQSVPSWISTDTSPSSAKTSADMNASWRSYTHESPVTPAFSPYTPQAPPSSTAWPPAPLGTPVGSEASSRADEVAWSYPAPTRSLSYGGEHHQSYPPMSQVGGHQASGRSYDSRKSSMPSDMYPPITTTIPNLDTIPGTSIDPHASLSAGAVPSSAYGTWQQNPYSYAKASEGYGGWYGDNAGHAEAHASSGGDNASLYYGSR